MSSSVFHQSSKLLHHLSLFHVEINEKTLVNCERRESTSSFTNEKIESRQIHHIK